jgi:hypothetical protein
MDILLLQYFLGRFGVLFGTDGSPELVVIGSNPPNNADGFPDGTVYIQAT